MEMHGIPHIKLKNIKTKSYMINWHIGTVLSSTKMKVTLPKEASGQVWSGFYRNAAGFTGTLHGQINFVLMMHSD